MSGLVRDVCVAGFAETLAERSDRDETEMLFEVIGAALADAGVARREIGFTVSGSCDFLVGRPFSFVTALDAAGAWPPIAESHVEMDGAWALHEAWVALQTGDVDVALVYAFGRSSLGPLRDVLALQLDPYHLLPLWPDAEALAALQAQALRDRGREWEITPRAPAPADGAAAVVLVAGRGGAVIRGIDHRIEPQALGSRDLSRSASTLLAARHAGALERRPDFAALHAPHPAQELIVAEALGLGGEPRDVAGGPMMVAGLTRIGAAARAIRDGGATRAVAHATSGPCLQQNLVCLLEKA